MILDNRILLTPLEVASGYVFGIDSRTPRLPASSAAPKPAFEAVLRRALRRPPTVVAFSGGRDSAAVLAVAVAVARREGLQLPVAATMRFPDSAESDETAWQERVIKHLGLEEWVRIPITDELDCVGPFARAALLRHGLTWPPNAHALMPLLESARGGSLVTGDGGDLVFQVSPWSQRVVDVLGGRAKPTPRDLLRLSLVFGPKRIRSLRLRRRYPEPVRAPWLRPHAFDAVVEAWSSEAASEPLQLDRRIPWGWGLRAVRLALASFGEIAREGQVELVHPFSDPRFAAALARAARSFRYADRTEAMQILFADVLPDDVCARSTKGGFRDVFWNRHAREFAAGWNGEGADADLVDIEALRTVWLSADAREHFRSCTQLQAAWLARCSRKNGASGPERVEKPLHGALHRVPPLRTTESPRG